MISDGLESGSFVYWASDLLLTTNDGTPSDQKYLDTCCFENMLLALLVFCTGRISQEIVGRLALGSVKFCARKVHGGCGKVWRFPEGDAPCPFFKCDMVECFYQYPLKILAPTHVADCCCQWIFVLTYGGGLVQGDSIDISVVVGEGCCILWTTQSFSKVYRCDDGNSCKQRTVYEVHSNSLLCIIPDPLVCFNSATYMQVQEIHLTADANLVFLDWFTCGRLARGERWEFSRLQTTVAIYFGNVLLLKDAQCLENTPFLTIRESMKAYNVLGICVIVGTYLLPLASKVLKYFENFGKYGERPKTSCIFAVSPLYIRNSSVLHGCIMRFAAESVCQAQQELEKHLTPLFTLLGANPFENK